MRPGRGNGPAVREALAAALVSVVVAVGMTWPALAHPRHTIPEDVGDPLLQAWQLAWGGHALLAAPAHPFDANAFWPLDHSLAFSDSLLGYAPAGLVGRGPAAALARYALLYVGAAALAALGGYLLAREVGVRSRAAAALAGAASAYAPWRIAQAGHLNILSTGGIALALALLLRGSHRRSRGWTLAGWGVAAWQLTLGFGLGLPFAYGLLIVALMVFAPAARRAPRLWPAHALGAALFALTGAALAQPYLAVVRAHPEARRTAADVALYSPPLRGFLVAPAEDRLWGGLTAGARARLSWPPEMALGLGATVLVLAVAGLLLARWPWRRRLLLAGAALVALLLGAGTTLYGGRFTYLPLLAHVPGWAGIRTPGRLVVFASLALGLLAAGGADALGRRWPVLPPLAVALALAEGVSSVPAARPAPVPAAFRAAIPPVLVLPSDQVADTTAMWWSTDGFPPLVNGGSGFVPRLLDTVRAHAARFPDPASVRYLAGLGVRTVVVRPGHPAPSAADLPVRRTAYADGSVAYRLSR